MRAAILRAHGTVPEPGELADPAPAPNAEVLDVLAGGMNPVDVRIASGTFPNERHEPPMWPATVPLDGGADLDAALREAAGGAGFDLVLDPLWGEPARAALSALKPFGPAREHGPVGRGGSHARVFGRARQAGPDRGNYTADEERKAAAYARMAGHALAGEIRVAIERVGLDAVPEAWRRQGSSPHRKLVVVP
jgi:NADPH:quinone reductase-like Zn-dependent oxidoreductase